MKNTSLFILAFLLTYTCSINALSRRIAVRPNNGHTQTSKSSTTTTPSSSVGHSAIDLDYGNAQRSFLPVASCLISAVRQRSFAVVTGSKKDAPSIRQRLAKAGLSVVLSYGTLSNLSAGTFLSVAWYAFSKQTGLSPLAPQQWKPFLAVYSACIALNNVLRPLVFASSVAVSPYFEKLIASVQRRTKLSRAWSVGLCIFLVNVVGTVGFMAGGVMVASTLAGVPII